MTAPTRAAGPVPAPPGAISTVALVGRDRELAALTGAVTRPPSVAVVTGEAGVGKTRLVAELRSGELAGGRPVLVGACRQVRDPFPLYPVVEAVRQLRRPLRGAALPLVTGALRPLLPELADLLPPAPEPTGDRLAERHRVFRALVELLRVAGPVVLVLEDLHWGDGHTPDFLRYLLAEPPDRLSLVLTYREAEVAPAIRALPARLPAPVHHAEVRLAPLDAAGTGALAAAILGTDQISESFASYLCQRASGLPFAIEELLALLRVRGSMVYRHGSWARRALDRLDVPAGIRDQVLERVSHLGPDTRAVLAAAAVLRVPVPLAVLTGTCSLPPSRVWQAVEEALAGGVVAETGGRIGFRHVLAAQAVYGAVPEIRRRRLHARAAEALGSLDPPPHGQVAHHLRHAGRTEAWVAAAEQAADQAIALGHDEQAVRLLEEVLRDAPLADDRAGRIAVTLGHALANGSGDETLADLLLGVLDRNLPGPARGELSLLTALAMDHGRSDVPRQRELCRVAVAHLHPDRHDLRSWAMACLGIPLDGNVPWAEHRDWLRRALAELDQVSDPRVQLRMLGKVAMVQVLAGDRQWRELLARLDRVAAGGGTEQPPYRVEAWAYYAIGVEACYLGHHDLAADLLARAGAYTASWERPLRSASLQAASALIDYCQGRWEGLRPRVDRLVDELVDFAPARTEAELVAGCLRLAQGDLAGARDRLAQRPAGDDHGTTAGAGIRIAATIRLALASGDPAGAAELVQRQLAAVRRQGMWAPISRCLPVMTEALVAAGDQVGARELLRHAAAELRPLDVPLAAAALRHSRGLLAAARPGWRRAATELLAAATEYDRLRCPYEAAQAREQAAGCQFAAGEPAAGETLRAALVAYQQLGAGWDLDRAARAARGYGVSPPARHRRGRQGYGDQLSPRQREVAQMVAAGRTNQEIAGELYLSVSTVEKHVAAVLSKLGAGSRRQVRERIPADSAS